MPAQTLQQRASRAATLAYQMPHGMGDSHVIFFFFPFFLGPHLRHMEVPGLGVEFELQLLACATVSATNTAAHGNTQILNTLSKARAQTHIPMILVGFLTG